MTKNKQITTDAQLVHRKLDLLLQVGCYLMDCSADTTLIVRDMKRVEAYLGLESQFLHVYINYNVILVNYSDESTSYTRFRKCDRHAIDMAGITRVSHLTWDAIRYNYSLDEYQEKLDAIKKRPRYYTPWQVAAAAGFACGGFCIQFGCDWPAFFYASLAAILGFRLRMFLGARGTNTYICIGVAAFVATIIAWLTSFLSLNPTIASVLPSFMHTETPWHPLLACALFIVPGVPLINFVSDMLGGHIQTGLIRALNVFLIVIAMVLGISCAIKVCGIDNFVKDLSMTPHHEYWEYALAAAISAMGFSMIFNIQRRLLWVVAIGGIIAVCSRNFVNLGASSNNIGLDWGPVMGSFAGSALISLIAVKAVHWFHTPHHCLSIPSVIPMVPGVLMYRALFAFIDMHGVVGEVTTAMNNGIRASLIILCIALGVAIPNIFARKLIAPERGKKLKKMIEERRQRGKFVDLNAMD